MVNHLGQGWRGTGKGAQSRGWAELCPVWPGFILMWGRGLVEAVLEGAMVRPRHGSQSSPEDSRCGGGWAAWGGQNPQRLEREGCQGAGPLELHHGYTKRVVFWQSWLTPPIWKRNWGNDAFELACPMQTHSVKAGRQIQEAWGCHPLRPIRPCKFSHFLIKTVPPPPWVSLATLGL